MADPRKALARAMYLLPQHGIKHTPEMFDAAWEWFLREEHEGRSTGDSAIGKVVVRVDAVMRWVKASGLELRVKE